MHFVRAAVLRAASLGAPLDPADLAEARAASGRVMPVVAADLAPLSGSALGARLRALERLWIDGGLAATREELLRS